MKAIITIAYGEEEIFKVDLVAKSSAKANELLIQFHASTINKADNMMSTSKPYVGRLIGAL
ncbi:MAG: hypothetical protein NXI09_07710 [Bacteroidetes bacterium]|nr:hypothetical protein [Bacteroidota bacterium]